MAMIPATLMPAAVAQQLLGNVYAQSVALQLGNTQPMPAGATNIPVIGTRPVAGFTNGVGGAKPFSTLDFTSQQITAEEVAVTVAVPQAYIDDAGFPLWDNVRPLLAEAIAKVLDAAIIFGTGAPATFPTGGIIGASTPAAAGADYSISVSNAMGLVEAGGYVPSGHVADVTVRAKLRELRSTQGVPLFLPDVTQAGAGVLYGLPIRFTQPGVMVPATAEFITGDWTKLVIGVRQDLRFDTSPDATLIEADGTTIHSMFQEDSIAMRAYMRVGAVIGKLSGANPWSHLPNTVNPLGAGRAEAREPVESSSRKG